MGTEVVPYQEPEIPIDLMDRQSNGVRVILYWMRALNACSIYIEDVKKNEATQFVVPNEVAMTAYLHPFAFKAMHDSKHDGRPKF